jgi:ribulose-5-phosphate 4-epimerase/fuculose-1-phosphate aldolase
MKNNGGHIETDLSWRIGQGAPVYDVQESYQPSDHQDLLIRTIQLGADLAAKFSLEVKSEDHSGLPDHPVVLMRRHGFTTCGQTIKEAVFRAVFTTKNAKIQTMSSLIRSSFESLSSPSSLSQSTDGLAHPFEPITPLQAKDTEASMSGTVDRPWQLWLKEVENQNLYVNYG